VLRFIGLQAAAIHAADPFALVTVGAWSEASITNALAGQAFDYYSPACLAAATEGLWRGAAADDGNTGGVAAAGDNTGGAAADGDNIGGAAAGGDNTGHAAAGGGNTGGVAASSGARLDYQQVHPRYSRAASSPYMLNTRSQEENTVFHSYLA